MLRAEEGVQMLLGGDGNNSAANVMKMLAALAMVMVMLLMLWPGWWS